MYFYSINTAKLIESGTRIFIAMELLEQGQLQTLIQERKKSGGVNGLICRGRIYRLGS